MFVQGSTGQYWSLLENIRQCLKKDFAVFDDIGKYLNVPCEHHFTISKNIIILDFKPYPKFCINLWQFFRSPNSDTNIFLSFPVTIPNFSNTPINTFSHFGFFTPCYVNHTEYLFCSEGVLKHSLVDLWPPGSLLWWSSNNSLTLQWPVHSNICPHAQLCSHISVTHPTAPHTSL